MEVVELSTNPVQTVDSDPSRHLWMHFSNMGAYAQGVEVPVIVRGEVATCGTSTGTDTSTA